MAEYCQEAELVERLSRDIRSAPSAPAERGDVRPIPTGGNANRTSDKHAVSALMGSGAGGGASGTRVGGAASGGGEEDSKAPGSSSIDKLPPEVKRIAASNLVLITSIAGGMGLGRHEMFSASNVGKWTREMGEYYALCMCLHPSIFTALDCALSIVGTDKNRCLERCRRSDEFRSIISQLAVTFSSGGGSDRCHDSKYRDERRRYLVAALSSIRFDRFGNPVRGSW